MPLPEQRLDIGSLESAQFAGNNLGGLASLNSATANAICRTALFNQSDGQAAARNIVLTVAPTSAAPPQPPPPAFKRSLVDMETMPSAESQKAADMPAAAAAVYAAQPLSGVATRGLRQGARRNPPRYSDFTDDLSDTDSPGESYDEEEEDLDGFSEDNSSRRIGLRSRGSSLQSADASQFRSAMSGGDSGREGRRGGSGGVAPKRPRSKSLLCEQDPEAPGLTLEQRRKIRRRINNRASARRVRQKREEELHKISAQVTKLDQEKQQLSARVLQSQTGCSQLALQLKEIHERWQLTCLTNATLHKELMGLREVWQRARGAAMSAAQQQAPMSSMGPPPAASGAPAATSGPPGRMGGRPSLSNLASLDLASFLAN
ncbi:hypothetical protein WJX75_006170 [Coccomyxa subellipsoidea]|uniref:BZIP domain-containing protein n=1 Tax=Coccomyxa subellipsoidea TaxID=248742 RepID=A0ABR2Z070_9CHLO